MVLVVKVSVAKAESKNKISLVEIYIHWRYETVCDSVSSL